MKKVLKIFCLIILSLFIIPNVSATTNPYSKNGPYGTNCTWYVWNQVKNKKGLSLPGWGNAKDWLNSASKAGYETGSTPKAGSIVVWDITSYGHVGYVERVEGNYIYVWDSDSSCIDKENPTYIECEKNAVDEQTSRACEEAAPKVACTYALKREFGGYPILYSPIMGFIYLNNVPSNKASNSPINTKTSSKSKITEVKKSSNNTLSELNVDNYNIKFNKDTLEYFLEVEYEIEKINIVGKPESEKASLDGLGEKELAVGENIFTIKVTAEDKSVKEYKIKIVRKEKIVVKDKLEITKEKTKKNNFGGLIVTILVFAGLVLIVILKRLKKQKFL